MIDRSPLKKYYSIILVISVLIIGTLFLFFFDADSNIAGEATSVQVDGFGLEDFDDNLATDMDHETSDNYDIEKKLATGDLSYESTVLSNYVQHSLSSSEFDNYKTYRDESNFVLVKDGEIFQYIPFEVIGSKVTLNINHNNYDSVGLVYYDDDGGRQWYLDIIDASMSGAKTTSSIDSPVSTCIWDTAMIKDRVDGMVGQPVCSEDCGADNKCDDKQPGDICGSGLRCDPNCDCLSINDFESCSDNIQNQDEEGIDCGGSCAPCNTVCNTNSKYAPSDSGCTDVWPNGDGTFIYFGNDVCAPKCDVMEICSEELDYIVEEASDCCLGLFNNDHESSDYSTCDWARDEADNYYGGDLTACRGLYYIKASSNPVPERRYLRYDYGGDDCQTDGYCGTEGANSPYTEGLECKAPPCYSSDVRESNDYEGYLFNGINDCFSGTGWTNDYNMDRNYCWMSPQPVHVMSNIMESGNCIGKSMTGLTLLRKMGFDSDSVWSVVSSDGTSGHNWLAVLFPNDNAFHFVDLNRNQLMGYSREEIASHEDQPEGFCNEVSRISNDVEYISYVGTSTTYSSDLVNGYPVYGCDPYVRWDGNEVDLFCDPFDNSVTYGVILS